MKDWWQINFPDGRQTLNIIDANGYPVKIAYAEKGVGKPLVLLHGLGSWSYNWRHIIEPLSQYFRVICFDAKGFGFSSSTLSHLEQSGHQVIELERIIQAICDQPPVIIAESLGALAALALAVKKPQLVHRIVVINVPVFAEQLPHWIMSLLAFIPIELIQTVDSQRLTYWFAPLVRELMAGERRKVLFNPATLTQEDIYWITYPYIELPGTLVKIAEELKIAIQEIRNFQLHQPNMLSHIQNNLHRIECPTLILWGEQDSWFPLSHGIKLDQCLPNSRLFILHNCNHDALTEAFEVINTVVLEFLQDMIS